MRIPLFLLLVLAPVVAAAYHYGPGQQQLALDNARIELNRAASYLKKENYQKAIAAYSKALEFVPASQADLQRDIRLERAKALLQSSQLPEAYDELTSLGEEAKSSKTAVPDKFVNDLRKTSADAQYYMTWLQRLEGEAREAWEPDIEASRQKYKLLEESARSAGDEESATRFQGDLEAAIRLARLDLSELQALPLPKQCQGCCSGNCKCKSGGKRPGNKQSESKSEDARGASSGPPPDGKGS